MVPEGIDFALAMPTRKAHSVGPVGPQSRHSVAHAATAFAKSSRVVANLVRVMSVEPDLWRDCLHMVQKRDDGLRLDYGFRFPGPEVQIENAFTGGHLPSPIDRWGGQVTWW